MIDIDVAELLSWALIDQNAAYFCDLPTEHKKRLMSSTAIVTGTLALGGRIDCQPGFLRRMGARCHPDAVAVWFALPHHDKDMLALLVQHGRARSCPDWSIWPELKPKRHFGNHRVVVETEYDDAGRIMAQWCPLEGYPSQDLIRETRWTYSRWHAGLAGLKQRVSGMLTAHRVTGPAMPAAPWAVDNLT